MVKNSRQKLKKNSFKLTYKLYGCIWLNKIVTFKKKTLYSVEVLSSPNLPPLFVTVFWGETNRSSLSQMFFKIGVLKKCCKFHRKTSVLQYLFNEVAVLKTCNVIKKRLQHRCFPVIFAISLRMPFFTEHLCWLLLNKPRRPLWFIVWESDLAQVYLNYPISC